MPPQSEYNGKCVNILLCLHTFVNVNTTVGAIMSPMRSFIFGPSPQGIRQTKHQENKICKLKESHGFQM